MTTKFVTINSKFNLVKRRTTNMSVSQSGCILHRLADTYPPNELLEKILEENASGWGAATAEDGEFKINSAVEGTSLVEIQQTLEAFPDKNITFYFCSAEVALSLGDVSPYILVCKEADDNPEQEIPQVLAFIRGNFPAYAQAGSSHPPEYHLVQDILIPKFENLYEMVDGDLDKLMTQLKKPHFKKELLLTSVSEGTITIAAANGETLTFSQGDQSVEGPWGWCSNGYGYGKEEKKVEAPAKEKKPSLFSNKSTVREKHIPPQDAEIAAATKAPVTGSAVIKNYTVKKDRPGDHLSRADRKDWYKSKIGYIPPGWEKRIAVNVYLDPEGKLATFSQMNKALGLEAAKLIALANNPARGGKNVEPDHVEHEQTLPAESKTVTAEVLPIMGPKTREHINDIRNKDGYKKIIDENARTIADPKQVEAFETKFADFARQMKVSDMREFACWDFEMIYDLCKTDPMGGAVMLNTFKNFYLKGQPAFKAEETTPQKKPSLFAKGSAAA